MKNLLKYAALICFPLTAFAYSPESENAASQIFQEETFNSNHAADQKESFKRALSEVIYSHFHEIYKAQFQRKVIKWCTTTLFALESSIRMRILPQPARNRQEGVRLLRDAIISNIFVVYNSLDLIFNFDVTHTQNVEVAMKFISKGEGQK